MNKSGAKSTAKRWTCDICQKGMYLSNQETHLAGRPHLERLALTAQQNLTPPQSTANDVNAGAKNVLAISSTGIPSESSGPSWKCHVCDSKRMPMKEKGPHRATAEHRRRLGFSTNDAGASRSSTGHSGGLKAGPGGSGGSGGGSVSRSTGPGGAPGGDGSDGGGGPGGLGGPSGPKKSKFNGKLSTSSGGVPGGSGPGGAGSPGGGSSGPKKSKSRGKPPTGSGGAPGGSGPGDGGGGGGGPGGGPSGPQKSKSKGKRRAPRAPVLEDSDYDSDDLRALLYDIDTQWGMLPHGGAYKESEIYYSARPSFYDWGWHDEY
ncbi:hypothetical protein C8J56DRAFT_90656 [Mycena floridula]|nr:hypothetical protein C8J56DRAFT_90656 [Mycena floridula]